MCEGSPGELKATHGAGYTLTVKVGEQAGQAGLQAFLLASLPGTRLLSQQNNTARYRCNSSSDIYLFF